MCPRKKASGGLHRRNSQGMNICNSGNLLPLIRINIRDLTKLGSRTRTRNEGDFVYDMSWSSMWEALDLVQVYIIGIARRLQGYL